MKIELVVSAFGRSPHLISCLRSLVEQRAVRSGVAGIVVATSTPSIELEAAAACFGARYEVNPFRKSIGADWNFALSAARTPLVAICHQDDTYAADFATKMLDLFSGNELLLMASSTYSKLDSEGRERRSLVLAVKRFLMWRAFGLEVQRWGPSVRRPMLSWGNPVCCSSVVFNKELLSSFQFDVDLESNLDWDAWDRISKLPGLIAYLPEPLVRHRVHGGSATSRLIASSARPIEDLMMLSRFWPPAVARAWLMVYSQAYRSHRAASGKTVSGERAAQESVSAGNALSSPEPNSSLQLKGLGPAD